MNGPTRGIIGVQCSIMTCAACCLLPAAHATAQDWPQWLGENRNATVSGFDAPDQWPAELTRVWSVEIGDGVATPSLVNDWLYTFSRNETHEIIRCLDVSTGDELWADSYEMAGADGAARSFAGPRSAPAVAAGKVLTIGVRGTVSCMDAETGELLWRKDDFNAYPRFYTSSSPIILNDLAITQLGNESGGAVVAYALETGEERWRATTDGTTYASLSTMKLDNGRTAIIATTTGTIAAIDTTDGSELWSMPFVVRGRGYNAATPIAYGNEIVVAGSGRGTRIERLTTSAVDGLSATEEWVNEDNSVMYNTPIRQGNHVYGISDGGVLFCIDATDGATAWEVPTVAPESTEGAQEEVRENPPQRGRGRGRGGRGGGRASGYGSIVDAGDVLFALTPNAELIVFKPGTDQYTELARYKVAEGGTFAYPIVSGNRVFIKDANAVTLWTIE